MRLPDVLDRGAVGEVVDVVVARADARNRVIAEAVPGDPPVVVPGPRTGGEAAARRRERSGPLGLDAEADERGVLLVDGPRDVAKRRDRHRGERCNADRKQSCRDRARPASDALRALRRPREQAPHESGDRRRQQCRHSGRRGDVGRHRRCPALLVDVDQPRHRDGQRRSDHDERPGAPETTRHEAEDDDRGDDRRKGDAARLGEHEERSQSTRRRHADAAERRPSALFRERDARPQREQIEARLAVDVAQRTVQSAGDEQRRARPIRASARGVMAPTATTAATSVPTSQNALRSLRTSSRTAASSAARTMSRLPSTTACSIDSAHSVELSAHAASPASPARARTPARLSRSGAAMTPPVTRTTSASPAGTQIRES